MKACKQQKPVHVYRTLLGKWANAALTHLPCSTLRDYQARLGGLFVLWFRKCGSLSEGVLENTQRFTERLGDELAIPSEAAG
jgi:hypothetical protein